MSKKENLESFINLEKLEGLGLEVTIKKIKINPPERNQSYLVPTNTPLKHLPQAQQAINYFNYIILNLLKDSDVWIAGGAIRDYLSNGKIDFNTDIDLFSYSRKELCRALLILRNKASFKPYLITKNAIKGTCTLNKKEYKVDIVKRIFDNMVDTIENFDFTVTCFALNSVDFVCHPSAPFDLLAKRLVINSLPFPLSTFQRLQKYIKKGYWICNGGMLEISKSLSKIDFDNPDENTIEFYPNGGLRFVRYD